MLVRIKLPADGTVVGGFDVDAEHRADDDHIIAEARTRLFEWNGAVGAYHAEVPRNGALPADVVGFTYPAPAEPAEPAEPAAEPEPERAVFSDQIVAPMARYQIVSPPPVTPQGPGVQTVASVLWAGQGNLLVRVNAAGELYLMPVAGGYDEAVQPAEEPVDAVMNRLGGQGRIRAFERADGSWTAACLSHFPDDESELWDDDADSHVSAELAYRGLVEHVYRVHPLWLGETRGDVETVEAWLGTTVGGAVASGPGSSATAGLRPVEYRREDDPYTSELEDALRQVREALNVKPGAGSEAIKARAAEVASQANRYAEEAARAWTQAGDAETALERVRVHLGMSPGAAVESIVAQAGIVTREREATGRAQRAASEERDAIAELVRADGFEVADDDTVTNMVNSLRGDRRKVQAAAEMANDTVSRRSNDLAEALGGPRGGDRRWPQMIRHVTELAGTPSVALSAYEEVGRQRDEAQRRYERVRTALGPNVTDEPLWEQVERLREGGPVDDAVARANGQARRAVADIRRLVEPYLPSVGNADDSTREVVEAVRVACIQAKAAQEMRGHGDLVDALGLSRETTWSSKDIVERAAQLREQAASAMQDPRPMPFRVEFGKLRDALRLHTYLSDADVLQLARERLEERSAATDDTVWLGDNLTGVRHALTLLAPLVGNASGPTAIIEAARVELERLADVGRTVARGPGPEAAPAPALSHEQYNDVVRAAGLSAEELPTVSMLIAHLRQRAITHEGSVILPVGSGIAVRIERGGGASTTRGGMLHVGTGDDHGEPVVVLADSRGTGEDVEDEWRATVLELTNGIENVAAYCRLLNGDGIAEGQAGKVAASVARQLTRLAREHGIGAQTGE